MLISNFLPTPKIFMSDCDKNFLKEFSRNFHQKIIDTNDFSTFDNSLSEWIKNIDKNAKTILKLMQNHKVLFSSIIGFFYQYGIIVMLIKVRHWNYIYYQLLLLLIIKNF